jgi:hypothetical protein
MHQRKLLRVGPVRLQRQLRRKLLLPHGVFVVLHRFYVLAEHEQLRTAVRVER